MTVDDMIFRPLSEVADLIRSRQTSATAVTEATLAAIAGLAPRLNCYVTVLADHARAQAREMDALLAGGTYLGPLHGIPISLKDNVQTSGIRTTAASAVLWDWVPTHTATVADRLAAAGAVLVAKANLHEFAYGSPHPRFGLPINPWRPGYAPGGSSSGSASAVAAGLCFGSIGSDTGGSIRVPAALCGIVGVKPSYGRVSRAGVIPLSYNLDVAGPMTRTVKDAAIMLQAIAGTDPADPFSADRPVPDFTMHINGGVRGLRLGVVNDAQLEILDGETRSALHEAYRVFEREGARLVPVTVPDFATAQTVVEVIIGAEAAEYHRPILRTRPHDYGPVVRLKLERNEFIPAVDYVTAQRARRKFIVELGTTLREVDALIAPAHPLGAYPEEAKRITVAGHDLEAGVATSRYTRLFSLTGNPAVVVPCGFTGLGLPIALQVVARPFDEPMMFRVARAYERVTTWHTRHPSLGDLAS